MFSTRNGTSVLFISAYIDHAVLQARQIQQVVMSFAVICILRNMHMGVVI
jgi:hypothetical protein